MSSAPDEAVLERVNSLGPTSWSGTCFRFTTARRDPLSGEGARRFGGRWNPPDSFPTNYLAQPAAACMAELDRFADKQHLAPEALLEVPYRLHFIECTDVPLLDLRGESAQLHVGLEVDDLTGDDWTACQSVGQAAWFLHFGGVLAPSATGTGVVVAVFEHRVEPGHLTVTESAGLTPELYRRLR